MTLPTRSYPLNEAIKAQQALRSAACLPSEPCPLPAFVRMIGDEIDALHAQGKTTGQIAELIRQNSDIVVSAEDLTQFYEIPHHPVSPHD